MEFLRSRSLQPGLGKLPVIPVVVVIDSNDPRPDLLASALESGVETVLERPLDRKMLTANLGEMLRRRADVEFVYKVQKTPSRASL